MLQDRPIYGILAVIFCLAAVALCAAAANGQSPALETIVETTQQQECTGRTCRLVTYQWARQPDWPPRLYLYREGVLVGGWNIESRKWLPHTAAGWGNVWSDRAPLPVPQVAPAAAEAPAIGEAVAGDANGIPNFGLVPGQISPAERWSHTGRPSSRHECYGDAAAAGLPDDANFCHLVVVGAAAERQRVLKDFADSAELADWRGQLHVHGCAPDGWVARLRGYTPGAGLTFYVTTAAGEDLDRFEGYDGAGALRDRLKKLNPVPGRKPEPPGPLQGLRNLSALTEWLRAHGGQIFAGLAVALILRGLLRDPK